MEGDEPPLDAAGFDAAGFAAGAAFDAELEFDAGAAAGAGAAFDFAGADDEALELDAAGAAADESDAAAFLERDFLVVPVEESVLAASVFDASVFEADASVESAAAFFDRDFLVVPVEESDEADADFESADASVESAAFFERDFLVVPVEESDDVEADESSAAAFDFLDFEVPDDVVEPELSSDDAVDFFFLDVVDEPLVLESSVVLPSAAAFFFFFFVVVLLSELESLEEPLADDDDDCAFADFAANDAEPKIKTAQASAVNICCHIFFMIVPPVVNDAKYRLGILLVGETGGIGLGLFEQAGCCGRFERCDAAIEMAAERRGQIRFEVVHDHVNDFLRLVLRQAGLLHDYLDEFIHG